MIIVLEMRTVKEKFLVSRTLSLTPRPPPGDCPDWVYVPDDPEGGADRHTPSPDEPGEVTFVDIDTFEATF